MAAPMLAVTGRCPHGKASARLCAFCIAAESFAPPPPERVSPVAFAERYSRGQYKRFRHVEIIEEAILDTIATGGRLILSASVRHSKSQTASMWFPAWYLGTHPDKRVILAGHEADFAARWGRAARDILTEHGPEVFGVEVSRRSEAANRWDLARPHVGGMLTVGVGGSPIGRGADLMVLDDVCKSFEDAMSPLKRRRLIDWWTGTMASRIEPGGAVILIQARWHEEDLAGFLLREAPEVWKELRLPALCDDPENDPMGRDLGEALWPERWPKEALEERRREVSLSLGEVVWRAQYQQRPTRPEGGMFPEDRWEFVSAERYDWNPRWVRSWDLAATSGGGDYTVGVLIGALDDGRTLIRDVRRGQWSADEVRDQIRRAAQDDPSGTRVELPQDPGQAGKDQVQQLTRMLSGYDVHSQPVTGSKEVRATGLSAQQRARNVLLWEAPWNGPFIAELAAFPQAAHDDQVDGATGGFDALHRGSGPVQESSWKDYGRLSRR
jgi:predicted phage terminase large subunit-like protein